jgi:hypothetical protein
VVEVVVEHEVDILLDDRSIPQHSVDRRHRWVKFPWEIENNTDRDGRVVMDGPVAVVLVRVVGMHCLHLLDDHHTVPVEEGIHRVVLGGDVVVAAVPLASWSYLTVI